MNNGGAGTPLMMGSNS